MTERTRSYALSGAQRRALREESLGAEAVEDLAADLQGGEMNSELRQAWVSKLVPPDADEPAAPARDDAIAVEFLLPSGMLGRQTDADTFWETFEYPDNRWPPDNEFRQFMEAQGHYSPEELPDLLGESVETRYDEDRGRWTLDADYLDRDPEQDDSPDRSMTRRLSRAASIVLAVAFAALVVATLRHVGVALVVLAVALAVLVRR